MVRITLTLAFLATLAACRVDVEPDGDGDADADADVGDLECCVICAEDELPCGDECVPLTDPDHELCRTLEGCACAFGEVCRDGGTLCGDDCVDLWTDENNCWECGAECGEGETCEGTCFCDELLGYTPCGLECCSPDETCSEGYERHCG